MAIGPTLARQSDDPGLFHMGRRPAAEPDDTLDLLPFDLIDEGGGVLDLAALRQRLVTLLDDTAEGLALRMIRAPGGTATQVFVPFRVLFPAGGRGFIIPELQEAFVVWRRQQKTLWLNMSEQERIDWITNVYGAPPPSGKAMEMFFGPEAFVRRPVPHPTGQVMPANTRGAVLIEALMGPTAARAFGVAPPSKYALKMWPSTNTRRVLRATPDTALADTAADYSTRAGLRSHVEQALDDLGLAGATDVAEMTDFLDSYVLEHVRRDKLAKWFAENVEDGASPPPSFLQSLEEVTLADVSEDVITSITGKRAMHPTELAHRMIEARDLTDQWIREISGDTRSYASFQGLEGFSGLFDAVIRRDGWQKGHVFEIECLIDLAQDGTSGIRLQVYFGKKKGPDFVLDDGAGGLLIKQAKSHSHYYRLVGSRRRFGGEFLSQFRSDLRRMLEEGDAYWPAGGPPRIRTGPGSSKPVNSNYEFLVDDARLSTWIDPATPNGIDRIDALRQRGITRMDEFETEVNGFLSAAANDGAKRDAIRQKCQEIVKRESGEVKTVETLLGEQIDDVIAGIDGIAEATLDDIHPRLLFAMRLAMDDKTGVVNVKLARRIFQMDTPFQLGHRRIAPDSFVPWQGEFPDKIAARHAEEDALGLAHGPWQRVEISALTGRSLEP